MNKKNIILIDLASFKGLVGYCYGDYDLQKQQLEKRMNSTLINLLLWQIEFKKIRFEEICLLNEKNLEIIRSSINNEEIIDKN